MVASIIQTLEQTQVWHGQDGRVLYVGELDDEYLGNIIAYLNRNAERLLEHRRWYDEQHDHATDVEQLLGLEPLDPITWLHDRPLYRTLLAEQRRRASIDGEVVLDQPRSEGARSLDEVMDQIYDGYGDALRELGE